MNNTEIYFARQNMLWNIGFYFIIIIAAIVILLFIGDWIYNNWLKSLIEKIKEKRTKRENKRRKK